MMDLADTIDKVAASAAERILILGESGTGKALVAKAIHVASGRAKGPFIEVNCASLPEQLIEAELFGAEKGAYTGAHQRRVGLVALADQGSLFLDEIGEIPLALQAKLLHFLENGHYRAIGSGQEKMADVRVTCSSSSSRRCAPAAKISSILRCISPRNMRARSTSRRSASVPRRARCCCNTVGRAMCAN
jgi:transcriptional regulator with PAS, ATPase and Fis domain